MATDFWNKLSNVGLKLADFLGVPTATDIKNSLVAKEYTEKTEKWLQDKYQQEQNLQSKISEEKSKEKKQRYQQILDRVRSEKNPYEFLYEEAAPTLQKSTAQQLAGALSSAVNIGLAATGGGRVAAPGQTGKLVAAKELEGAGKAAQLATQAGTFGVQSAATGYGQTGEAENIPRDLLIGAAEGVIFGEVPGIQSRAGRLLTASGVGAAGAYARGARSPEEILSAAATTGAFQAGGEVLNKIAGGTGAAEDTPILGAIRKNINENSGKIFIRGQGEYKNMVPETSQPIRLIDQQELGNLLATGKLNPTDSKLKVSIPENVSNLPENVRDSNKIMVVLKKEIGKKVKNEDGSTYLKNSVSMKDVDRIILPSQDGVSPIAPPQTQTQTPEPDVRGGLNEADQKRFQILTEQARDAQRIVAENDPKSSIVANAKQRLSEIQEELNGDMRTRYALSSMDDVSIGKTLFGDQETKNLLQMKDGPLIKAMKESGINENTTGEQAVQILNKKGYSFDTPDEILMTLKAENEGARVQPQTYSVAKMTDKLNAGESKLSIDQVKSAIDDEQLPLFTVAQRELSDGMRDQIKQDILDTGKVSGRTWESLKDELYRNKLIDTETAIQQEYYSFNKLRRELDNAGMDIPDEILRAQEQKVVDRVLGTARGNIDKILDRLQGLGIREDVIKSAKIANKYPLNSSVKVKREPNGEISAVIDKGLIANIKNSLKIKPSEFKKFFTKNSFQNLKRELKNTINEFAVPQVWMERLGLKEHLYDPIRQGSRDAQNLESIYKAQAREVLKPLSRQERYQITDFFATKQGMIKELKEAGIKPVSFNDLNEKQKSFIVWWDKFRKEIEPQIIELSRLSGEEMKPIEWYFPMLSKRNQVHAGGAQLSDLNVRKNPLFRSLLEREEGVPYSTKARDAWDQVDSYIHGATRFLEVGKRSTKIKYLINSDQFKEIFGFQPNKGKHGRWETPEGADIYNQITDWFKESISPTQLNVGTFNKLAAFLRKSAYRSGLGWNPRTIAKQATSYIDMAIGEGMAPESEMVKQLSKQGFASVSERIPDITIGDMQGKVDRNLLGGIALTDKYFANKGFRGLLSKELNLIKEQKGKINNKDIRKAIRNVSDNIDLAMGGVTPEQRPKIYKTELGKLGLMFTSTMNSRLQWYLKQTVSGINNKDAAKLAKIGTAFIMSSYAEMAINDLAFKDKDTKTTVKKLISNVGGNIPLLGSLIFMIQSGGQYEPIAAYKSLKDAIQASGQALSGDDSPGQAVWSWLEAAGLPKQIRRTTEGVEKKADIRYAIGGKNIDYKKKGKSSSKSLLRSSSGSSNSSKSKSLLRD